ncbi:hypothetical protein KAX21_05185 [candidate division WOR-3 bacterium]|nr:hypothetical protein [candidate division WOR-3 bacterium]
MQVKAKTANNAATDIYVGPMIHLIKITFRVVFELPTASRIKYTPGGWYVTPQVMMPNVRFECNSSQKSWTKATQKLVRSWTNDGQNHGGPREIEKQFRGVKKVGQIEYPILN